MAEKKIDLGLTALDELFSTEEQRQENKLPRIRDIPLDQIDDMPNHPYKVRMDEDMDILVESVKSYGIITPVILRKKEDGRIECAAGHRRRRAAEIAGFATVDYIRRPESPYSLARDFYHVKEFGVDAARRFYRER